MTFRVGGVAIGSAPVVGGVATLVVSTLPLGTTLITANYSGDANFLPSLASNLLAQGVVPVEVPTLGDLALAVLGVSLAAAALFVLRGRGSFSA